jgi:hypothetical protein
MFIDALLEFSISHYVNLLMFASSKDHNGVECYVRYTGSSFYSIAQILPWRSYAYLDDASVAMHSNADGTGFHMALLFIHLPQTPSPAKLAGGGEGDNVASASRKHQGHG